MIIHHLINCDERSLYVYHFQVMTEFVLGHALLMIFSFVTGHFADMIILLLSFDMLRQSTGGFHCKTNIGCVITSFSACSLIFLIQNYISSIGILYQTGGLLSMIFIFCAGAVNHPDLHWSEDELNAAKKRTRKTVLLFIILQIVAVYVGLNERYIYYFDAGIILCAVFLVLAFLISGKGGSKYEDGYAEKVS